MFQDDIGIEVINNSSRDLELEVIGMQVNKGMTKRLRTISFIFQEEIINMHQPSRVISKRHVLQRKTSNKISLESFDIVCVKLYYFNGKIPIREEKMTCDWIWTITDDSLIPTPILSDISMKLPKFDMNTISEKTIKVIIFGHRGTGKTNLAIDILQHQTDVQNKDKIICAILSTEREQYCQAFPEATILKEYDSIHSNQIMNILQQRTNAPEIVPSVFVLDDCTFLKVYNDKIIQKLFENGKCMKQSLILTLPYPEDLPLLMKTQIDYLFVYKEPCIHKRKRIWNYYLSNFMSLKKFIDIVDRLGDDKCAVFRRDMRGCEVSDNIDMCLSTNNQQIDIFWYDV